MKGQVASILIVVALMAGSGIGYFASMNPGHTTTETVVTTYTVTLPQGPGLLRCVVTEYTVWMVGYASSGTVSVLSYSTTTEETPIQTYTSSTSLTQTVGFAFTTASTAPYTVTLTGPIAEGNYTTCTYAPG